MKRIIYLFSIVVLLSIRVAGQSFEFVKQAGGTGYDVGAGVAVDNQGNIFMTGYLSSTCWFDSIPVTSNGCYDPYLVKLNNNGTVQWAKSFGGTICDYSGGMCVDDNQNIFISGIFQISIDFGDTVLLGNGDFDVFIAKFDNNGNFLWAKAFSGAGSDQCRDLKYRNGFIYISGSFSDTVSFGSINLMSSGLTDCFLAKIDTAGNIIWVKKGGGAGYDYGWKMDVDSLNNIFLAGTFSSTATFGTLHPVSNGGDDVFICKYRSDGKEQWLKAFGGIFDDQSGCLTVDHTGNIYFSAVMRDNFSIDTNNLYGNSGFMILKFDNNGVFQWTRQDGCTWQSTWLDILIDDYSNIFMTGVFSQAAIFDGDTITATHPGYYKACFAKISDNGSLLWLKHTNLGSCAPYCLQSVDDSTLIITGVYSDSVDFDDIIITPIGSNDIFLAKLSNGIHTGNSEIITPSCEFHLFPNPAEHSITIELKDLIHKDISITIFNSIGSLVYKGTVHDKISTIDISFLSNGLYVVNLQNKNYLWTKKFIKD